MKNRINHQNDIISIRNMYNKMSSFDWNKNSHNHRNIFRTKGGKRKTTKGISGCHGYHETSRWNMWRSTGEGLCSLQEMDQRKMQQKFYGSLRAIKLLFNTRKVWRLQYVCIPKSPQHVPS